VEEKVKGKRKWDAYALLRLDGEMAAALDAAAARLGVTRTNLVRMLVTNYIALIKVQKMHPAVALLYPYPLPPPRPEAPAKLPAGVDAEQGEPRRGDEPQLAVAKTGKG